MAKLKTIGYSMLRKTELYENDRAEVTLELDPGDSLESATDQAKACCEIMLGRKSTLEEQAREVKRKLGTRLAGVSASDIAKILAAAKEGA